MEQEKDSIFSGIFGMILCLYSISTQIMAIYFWVQYIKKDSLAMALLIDPFIAEIKGILWPFFI